MELTDLHLVAIGVVAGILAQVIKVWRGKSGEGLADWARDGIIFVGALGLAFMFGAAASWPVFPVWSGDVGTFVMAAVDYLSALVVMIGQVVGPAHVIYIVLKRVVYEKVDALKS